MQRQRHMNICRHTKFCIMTKFPYEVGCKLRASLERTESLGAIKNVPIAVSIFHILNHSPACQLSCHLMGNAVWGLQDSDHLERMWSNLSGFISMTRSIKFRRACLLRRDALKALRKARIEEDDEERLQNLQHMWDQQIRNTLASITNGKGKLAASDRAIKNPRVVIAILSTTHFVCKTTAIIDHNVLQHNNKQLENKWSDEATSVLKYANTVVEQLEDARTKAWKKQQSKPLEKIADTTSQCAATAESGGISLKRGLLLEVC
ncbi:hypothetical protein BDC45DRAFT_534714 [Circinella umbellata]|nr:hypothetical protein BDC45DRAFT_534714 [Circinella umbellata]